MKISMEDKLKMCEEHVIEKKTISHISERYGNFDIGKIKYLVKLYRKFGKEPFLDREIKTYKRDTKLLLISRVKNGESIRSVALDFGLIDPSILGDWIKKYNKGGEQAIQATFSRKNYLPEDERYEQKVNQSLKEENEKLKAEIEYLKKSQSLAQKIEELTAKEKAKVVNELRTKFSLKVLLDIAVLPSSVFYYQLNAMKKANNKYFQIEKEIDYLFLTKHKKRSGYQRIYIELKKQGIVIGKNKVLEIMRSKGYIRKRKINYRKYNSYEGDLGGVKTNILKQDFKTTKPYEKAGTDITMFRVREEAVYLSPVIDFNSREVLAYEVGTDAKVKKVLSMIYRMKATHKKHIEGMIIQTDQGVQYQNSRYSDLLKDLEIVQSMSRKGNCLDNSPTENFFGRMKDEMWYGQENKYETSNDLIEAIHEYIKYYNEVRIVTKLKSSPIEYRKQILSMVK